MLRAKLTTSAKRADLVPSVMLKSGVIDPCRCPMAIPLQSRCQQKPGGSATTVWQNGRIFEPLWRLDY